MGPIRKGGETEVVRENEGGWKDRHTDDLRLEEINNVRDRKETYRGVAIPSVP